MDQTPFRAAALRLDAATRHDDAWIEASRDAAVALVELARTHEVAVELTPLPVWTVHCFQMGDVTPDDQREFSDPSDAVLWCVGCGNPDHVVSEVVGEDPEGLRWTALTRDADVLAFHAPDVETVQSAQTDAGGVSAVLAHWKMQLQRWARPAARMDLGPRPPTLGQRVESRLTDIEQSLERLQADVDQVLKIVSEQSNASVASMARHLRDRWVR